MKKRNSVAHFIPRTVTMQEATETKGGLDLQGAASLLMAMMQASADADGHNALMEQLASAMGYKLVRETPQPRQRSRSKKRPCRPLCTAQTEPGKNQWCGKTNAGRADPQPRGL